MRPKRGFCLKPKRKICTIAHKIRLTSCSPPTHSLFCSCSHGPSVTSGGVFYPALVSANVAGNLQSQIPVLPSTPLTLLGESLGLCLQHGVKYCMEIGNRSIHPALLSEEENHEIWKQSDHIWHCYARLISSVFHHSSVFCSEAVLKLYCFQFGSSLEHWCLKEVCFTLHCIVQTCQQCAWTLKSYL